MHRLAGSRGIQIQLGISQKEQAHAIRHSGLAFHMLVPVLTEGAWNTEYDLAWNWTWCGLAYTTAI